MKPDFDIEIVPQKPTDVEEVAGVYYQAWLVTYPNESIGVTTDDIEHLFKNLLSEEEMEKRRKYVESLPASQLSLVAKHDGKIVGICGVQIKETFNVLRTIYILPEYHGKGIGSKLWEEAQKFLDETNETIVEVADYNQQAINFYRKLGFKDTGKRSKNERFPMKSGALLTKMEMKRKADKPR